MQIYDLRKKFRIFREDKLKFFLDRKNISRAIKIFSFVLAVFLLSACMEIFYFNYHAIRNGDSGKLEISAQKLLSESTGFVLDGSNLVSDSDKSSIQCQFETQYYSKLIIEYESVNDGDMSIVLGSNDTQGNPQVINLTDHYDHRLTKSVTNINDHINSIQVTFPTDGVTVKSVSLDNAFQFNMLRYTFMVVAGLLFVFILFSKKIIAEKIELAFLITAFSIGILLLFVLPFEQAVVWDDATHFGKIYQQSFGREAVWTQAAFDYNYAKVPGANTIEENTDVIKMLNNENDYNNPVEKQAKSLFVTYNLRAYLPQSVMMFAARNLGLSFTSTLTAARMGGYLFYVLIMYAALRIAKFGKRIIAAVALMPTPLFLAANFSYDPFIISLSILAFAVFTTEYFDLNHKLKWKSTAVFLAATILACSTKAVYIPMILVLLLLPKEKFQSKRSMLTFRAGIIVIFLAVMATFVLPTVINPSDVGDLRGGNTSISGQLSFILANPLYYTRVLLKGIWDTAGLYLFGGGTYLSFAYIGKSSDNCWFLFAALIVFVTLTDTENNDRFVFKKSSKLVIFLLISAVVCLIWTAMYIAVTPLGVDHVNGVQGRYYLPLVIPLLFLLRNTGITTTIRPSTRNRIVFLTCSFIALVSMYDLILKPYNF